MRDNHSVESSRFPVLTLAALLLALTVVFFPALFFGRVISPMDTVESRLPWRNLGRPVEVANPELEEPAIHYLPLAALARRGPGTAVWNPHVACGTAGYLSWDAGIVAPTTLLSLPLADAVHLPNAMVLLKLLLAFLGTWLLARGEGAGEVAAVTGASVYALALPLAGRWLWPASATAAALPLLLWTLARVLRSGRPWRWGLPSALAWLAFLAGGDPAVTASGLYLLAAWVLYLCIARRTGRRRGFRVTAVAAALALAILAPSLGMYLAMDHAGAVGPAAPPHAGLGVQALRLLVEPLALGDPRTETFAPPAGLEGLQLHDLAIGTGSIAIALALLGLASRHRGTAFWAVAGGAGFLPILWSPAARLLGLLPGLQRAGPWELAAIPALATAMLAAAGIEAMAGIIRSPALRPWAVLLPAAIILQQGTAAGHLLTWLAPSDAVLPVTPAIRFLEGAGRNGPWRIAPLGDLLIPDTAQCFGLEDIRASRGATPAYVRLLRSVDPQSFGHYGSGLRLNPATADLTHPYLMALGPRFLLENPGFHLVEFSLGQHTLEIEPRNATIGPLSPRRSDLISQELHFPRGACRLALNATPRGSSVDGTLDLALYDEILDRPAGRWTVNATALAEEGFLWLNLPRDLATAHRILLTIRPNLSSGRLWLFRTNETSALDGPLFWGERPVAGDLGLSFDTSGYVEVADGPDLRIWENRRAAPRFWIVRSVLPGTLDTLVEAEIPLNLQNVAVVDGETARALAVGVQPSPARQAEQLALAEWAPDRYELRSKLASPGLLVASIPSRPSLWRAAIDGRPVELFEVDGLFLGLRLPAGEHVLTLRATLPRAWLALSALGLAGLIGLALTTSVGARTRDE